MRKQATIILLVCCAFGLKTQAQNTKPSTKRPNIIFILADDLGMSDIQGYAHHFTKVDTSKMYYETPNIDRLMQEGTSFSQAYANELCAPTRASLLTGKYNSKLGMVTALPLRQTFYNQNLPTPYGYYPHDVLEHKDPIKIEQAWINATSNSAVPTGTVIDQGKDEVSIAEALKNYNSAFIGKWHLGGFGAKGYQPMDNGFKTLAYYDSGASRYFNWRKNWNRKTKKVFPKMPQKEWEIGDSGKSMGEKYLTDELTQQALHFISDQVQNKKDKKPFFLYLCHFAVHAPYQGKKDQVAHFSKKKTKGWNNQNNPTYAAMLKSMDQSVGAILNKLKKTGIEDNTLVVFMSDNGGIDAEYTPNKKGTENAPFLGGKAMLTEGGIRVPLIFRWKGKIKAGQWVNRPVDMNDILPTFVDVARQNEQKLIAEQDLDGQSIIPLMPMLDKHKESDKKYTRDTYYWHYPFNVIYRSPYDGYALTPSSAIRKGDYKLIFDWYGRFHLYNIEKDPFEKNDLANKKTAKTQQLFTQLMNWLDTNVSKRYWPQINPRYNPKKEVRKKPFKNLVKKYMKDDDKKF